MAQCGIGTASSGSKYLEALDRSLRDARPTPTETTSDPLKSLSVR
jgi:hypothetical protein